MSTFADSSALVKLYFDEADDELIRAIPALVISRLARVEVTAALWRKQRMDVMSVGQARVIADAFELDYFGGADSPPRFAVITETTAVMEQAVRMTAVHGLRAYDAVQLAAACAARDVDPACSTLAAFDKQLRTAAAAEGFAVVPSD